MSKIKEIQNSIRYLESQRQHGSCGDGLWDSKQISIHNEPIDIAIKLLREQLSGTSIDNLEDARTHLKSFLQEIRKDTNNSFIMRDAFNVYFKENMNIINLVNAIEVLLKYTSEEIV